MKFWIYSNFKFLIILNSFETEIVLIIFPVLFTPHKIMSTSFFPQYINFKMNGLYSILVERHFFATICNLSATEKMPFVQHERTFI